MSLKTILLLIFTGLYFWAGQYWYTCIAKKVCGDGVPESAMVDSSAPEEMTDHGPITFKYKDGTALAGPKTFTDFKDALLSGKKGDDKTSNTDDNNLEIIGQYYKGESPETGMKRAESVRALLKDHFPESRMRLTTMDMSNKEVDPNSYFSAVEFKWNEVETKEAEIIQLADKAVMFFPSGSANPQLDPKIDAYLNDLVKRLAQTGESVELIGHTDNTGETETNESLGMNRANSIKTLLIKKGVNKDLIKMQSKGETQPIATNESEAGRHQNRRVEVILNKKQ